MSQHITRRKELRAIVDINEKIAQTMDQIIARIFRKDPADIAAHHELRMKEDLNANSKHYFPIIAAFEEEYGILVDYHMFQYSATTVASAIEYITAEYNKQKAQ